MRNIVHNYDQVVFGSNMHALLYAYVNQIPLFYHNVDKPKAFDFFPNDFSFLNIPNQNPMILNNQEVVMGMKKVELWKRISFLLGYEGLMPLCGNIQSARLDEGLLKITTDNSRLLRIAFNKMFIFDENIQGLPTQIKFNNQGRIYDYFEFLNLNEHKTMIIDNDSEIVNKLWLKDKNGVAITEMHDINDELPDYLVKMVIFDIAKKHDIKGKRNGIYHYRKELKIQRYNKLDFRLKNRVIQKTHLHTYEPTQSLEFVDSTPELEKHLLNNLIPNRTWKLLTI